MSEALELIKEGSDLCLVGSRVCRRGSIKDWRMDTSWKSVTVDPDTSIKVRLKLADAVADVAEFTGEYDDLTVSLVMEDNSM